MQQDVHFIGSVLIGALSRRLASVVRSDALITTKSRIALLTTEATGRAEVRVETENGRVTLKGTVASTSAKREAEKTVRAVAGVKEVRSLLRLAPGGERSLHVTSDRGVKAAVEAALKGNWNFAGILVDGVRDGHVALSGRTPTLVDTLKGIEAAHACAGVRAVATLIQAAES